MKPHGTLLVLAAVLAAATPRLGADENFFGYSYGTETLPRNKNEAYVWLTLRTDKGVGSYRALDNYNEIEHGFTDHLQGSLYLNTSAHHIEGNPEWPDTGSFGFEGVRTEWKYSLLSPFKDPIGLAVYLEPEYSRRQKISGERFTEYSIESKVLFQKDFRDDTIVSVLNLTWEHEWEKAPASELEPGEEAEFEVENSVEASGGVSYRVAPHWFLGGEVRAHALYAGGEQEFRALFAGPAVHYGGRRWWFTFTLLPQLSGHPQENSDSLFLGEHEKLETRLKVGFNF